MNNQETGNGKFNTMLNFPPKKPGMDKRTAEWVNAQHDQLEAGGLLWQR